MNTTDGDAIAATADPVWVKVAAANSLPAAKAAADFVCPGEHDEETLQAAIDRCAADGRDLFLFDGIYNIDAFREWGDGGPRAGLRIPAMLRHFTIRGKKFFQAGRGTIPDDKTNWRNGAILYVRKPVWDTAGEGVQLDLFTDYAALEREEKLQRVVLDVRKKYGGNALLRGMNFLEGGTARERNNQIGGHRA